ncbi:MAG: DinB family protein, partial [Candidatus Acidiferrales bacterium]
MKTTLVVPALLLLAASATAQTMPAQTQNPVSTALRDILPNRQKNTLAAVEAMPADKFNFKPSADQMTFGHLIIHMVETNNILCSKAAAVPAPKAEDLKDTDSKDGSAQEFVETRILGRFLKNDEFGLCGRHALSLQQQIGEIFVAA